MYITGPKEVVCGKDKTIYTSNGEKFVKQISKKKGDVYVSLEEYIQKKKSKGDCLNTIVDKRLQVLKRIFSKSKSDKKSVDGISSNRIASSPRRRAIQANRAIQNPLPSSSRRRASSSRRRAIVARRASSSRRRASSSRRRASSSRRRASAARRASSSRRRASAARRASSSRRRAIVANKRNMILDITNSSSFKLSNDRDRTPLIAPKSARKFTLSKSIKSKHSTSLGKKPCKTDCAIDNKICNFSSGRCVKPKKEKNVIVKNVPLDKIGVRPCKQDCTSINKICKISSRRCVNPPKQKPVINAKNIKPCKKDCAKDKKTCNLISGRCIKQKN